MVVAIALWMRLNPNDLKLMTAIIVVIALASNNDIFKIKRKKNKIKEVVGKGGDEDVKNSGAIQSIQS